MEAESLGFLLMDFFQYYSREFPYRTSYISVLRGGIFPKESKEWVREAHPEALAIESPLDPGAWLRRRMSVMLNSRTQKRTWLGPVRRLARFARRSGPLMMRSRLPTQM